MASYWDKNRNKLKLGNENRFEKGWKSGFVKPSGKFWKRYYNKRVRKGAIHKRDNHYEYC